MSRRIDLSLFKGDDSDEEEGLSLAQPKLALNDVKAKKFSHGVTKKTKWDLEKEAEEKKRQEEEEATRLALAEFNDAFSGHGGPSGRVQRGFVRSGERNVYNPINRPEPPSIQSRPRSPSPPPAPKRKGKRAMDSFLEEIKHNQEAREARFSRIAYREGISVTAVEAHEGSDRRANEQETTNLFVVNIPTSASEDSLGNLFASVGPVGTVKIMWPRGDDYARRSTMTGFVSYMNRADAELGLAKFDNYHWHGSVLRVSWSSKPVPIPRRPAYECTRTEERPAKKARNDKPAQDPEIALYWFQRVSPERSSWLQSLAARIKAEGVGLRKTIMERERTNPEYSFMFDTKSPEHHVFEYCLDEGYHFPDPPPPTFEDEGYASVNSTDSEEEAERNAGTGKARLGKLARRRFEAMLRSMSGKRVEIARAMEFALRRAEAADEIADLICESIQIDNTPIPRKMARLHLISDILHNSASPLPNVWRYRQAFEKQLPAICAHFAAVHDRLLVYSGSIAAEVFRQQVDAVLTIWERWIVFTADVHEILRGLLHKHCTLESLAAAANAAEEEEEEVVQPTFKSAGFKSSFKRIGDEQPKTEVKPPIDAELDGEALSDVDGEAMDELDGEAMDGEEMAMDEDVDGEPVENVDGEPVEDLDGEPVEDLDGEVI